MMKQQEQKEQQRKQLNKEIIAAIIAIVALCTASPAVMILIGQDSYTIDNDEYNSQITKNIKDFKNSDKHEESQAYLRNVLP